MKNIKYTFFLFIYCSFVYAQPSQIERPRLVIGIMIDGLQQKQLDILWNYFDPNGFKKMLGQGVLCNNMAYNIVSAGNASDIANVMTGTTPYFNGVVGDNFYNKSIHKEQSILFDENQVGIGTNQTLSAHNMLSSTVGDEIMLSYPSKSKSYSIGLNPEEAIMMAGHTARSVAWIDDVNLKWATTGYYAEGLSKWAYEMNENGTFKDIANRLWVPLYNINTYINKPNNEDKKNGFCYNPTTRYKQNSILKNTPSANSAVTELALKLIDNEDLGVDNYPDILMLNYTVRIPYEKNTGMQSAEKEDIYLRLDKEIQTLLHKVDFKIGADRVLFFVFGNQTQVHSPSELGDNKIPAGYFNADRSLALLNSYLIALYGNEKWVSGYYGKNIFLNKEKIENKKLNFNELRQNVIDFMLEFEGVQAVYSSTQLITTSGNADAEIYRLRNSTHKNNMGDVIFTLLPGWIEVDNDSNPVGESNAIVPYTPLYFYGWKLKPQRIQTFYHTTDIAPTLSRILDIPLPNACTGRPIEEILK